MSVASQSYIQWQQQQLEPDYRISSQGGRPRTKGGKSLWEDLKRRQDEADKWREWDERNKGDRQMPEMSTRN